MKILIIGGTGDARTLAQRLINGGYHVTYSIAGIVRKPALPCRVLTGGFSRQGQDVWRNGAIGLYWHLRREGYDLVIDATHPYSVQISTHAQLACDRIGLPLWRFDRKPWDKTVQDKWFERESLMEIVAELGAFQRPFFTAGREVFDLVDQRLPDQQWIVRTAGVYAVNAPQVVELKEIGPYRLADELQLFKQYAVDVLVTKNSGGEAVAPKLTAARELGLPVYILKRPALPWVERSFTCLDALENTIKTAF